MRFQLLLMPAAIVAAAPAVALDVQELAAAQAAIFPNATLTPSNFTLTEDQAERLARDSGSTVFRSEVRAWQASTGGWLFLDQVPGLNDRITYVVGLDRTGTLIGVEILVCVEGFCGIATPEWRQQFFGKRHNAKDAAHEISIISGSTLSTSHVSQGVNRVLATYALFLAPGVKKQTGG